jgi:stage V sporulation protein SpoVS
MRARPGDIANQFAGIGIDQKLVGIEAMAVGGIVGAVNAVAVERAGLQAWNVAVPDFVRILRQLDARRLDRAAVVEQAEFDPLGIGGKQGEVDAVLVRDGAKLLFYAGSPWHPRAEIPSVQNLPHPIVQRIILFRLEEPGMQIFRCPAWDRLLFTYNAAISFIQAGKTPNIIVTGLMS